MNLGNHITLKSVSLDKQEIENNTEERNKYLLLTLENYGKALSKDHNHNLLVYRFVSLWLLNTSNDEVNRLVDQYVKEINSAKFVDLLYQLAARLTDSLNGTLFPRVLVQLMKRCAQDHPFHTLPVLLALVNANADQEEENALGKILFLNNYLGRYFFLRFSWRCYGQASRIN